MYLIGTDEAEALTENWLIERLLYHMDRIQGDDAQALADEWGFNWPHSEDCEANDI
tara:strand:- start:3971 stop:4138 length:168 start_codon:yes stop_codon:yes gene_type:complete